jgi:hypothetical protein
MANAVLEGRQGSQGAAALDTDENGLPVEPDAEEGGEGETNA